MPEIIHELPPNAGRVIESLRDAGYEFETAIADIIDNSISAEADLVEIAATCSSKNGEISIAISDNGKGMDLTEVCNAMTYGSAERTDEHSLGKFGLGLKTASTSQCREVSLISRNTSSMAPVKLVLDIDRAAQTNKWEYLEVEPNDEDLKYLNHAAPSHSGTVVRWQKCDRILSRNFSVPGGAGQRGAFEQKLNSLRFHLGIVFQRFLDLKDNRAPNVTIRLNGERIIPWDPFCKSLPQTNPIYQETKQIRNDETGEKTALSVAAYIVPSRDELRADQEELVFPIGISPDKLQGLFIYRENRLIHWGDWCKLAKTEFHQRLCRIEISFGEESDEAFQVDFKKSRIIIAPFIAEWLKQNVLDAARSAADKRYRNSETAAAKREAAAIHERANNRITKRSSAEKAYETRATADGKIEVTNAKGATFRETAPSEDESEIKPITPVTELPDGILWQPKLSKDADGQVTTYVEINVSHPYYQRAYKASKGNSEAIDALDYLIWSIANAEYASKDSRSAENFEEMRREVSHTLRSLVKD